MSDPLDLELRAVRDYVGVETLGHPKEQLEILTASTRLASVHS